MITILLIQGCYVIKKNVPRKPNSYVVGKWLCLKGIRLCFKITLGFLGQNWEHEYTIGYAHDNQRKGLGIKALETKNINLNL